MTARPVVLCLGVVFSYWTSVWIRLSITNTMFEYQGVHKCMWHQDTLGYRSMNNFVIVSPDLLPYVLWTLGWRAMLSNDYHLVVFSSTNLLWGPRLQQLVCKWSCNSGQRRGRAPTSPSVWWWWRWKPSGFWAAQEALEAHRYVEWDKQHLYMCAWNDR